MLGPSDECYLMRNVVCQGPCRVGPSFFTHSLSSFFPSSFLPLLLLFLIIIIIINSSSGGFPGGSVIKNLPAMQKTQVQSLCREDPLEDEMATHSSILA